jgi:hypothetical protein
MIEIPNLELSEWLDDLKPYQKVQIEELISLNNEEVAAEKWLSANGPSNTIQFGGRTNETKPFYDNFKKEIAKFLCGHSDYDEQRKQLSSEAPVTKVVLLTIVSGVVATQIGVLQSLIVPAVALILHLIGKMSINAWCETNYAQ